jgi:uncharacterized protein (DUF2141 family)
MKMLLIVPSFAVLGLFAAAVHAGELTVTITDIRESQGSLMVAVVNSDAAWNNQSKPVAAQKVAATKGEMVLKFADLPAGKYAVQVMHDENGNNQLDANFLGIPSEGYGFSNNPNVMRRAHFDEATFEVGADKTAITIRLR